MGGGGAMRAAAKAAGMGVFTGGIRSGAVADTFAARKTVRPASAGGVSSDIAGGLKVDSTGHKPVWEVDDWEFAGGSEDDLIVDRVGPAKPTRMVFGPVPSLEEAKEATSELKEALEKVYFSSPNSLDNMDSASSLMESKACVTYESSVPKSAVQAFMFLKESPAAQTVVSSIACDPNVWNAVMQNPALVEFLQSESEKKKGTEFEVNESAESFIDSDKDEKKPDGLLGIFEEVKNSVLDMVTSLTNFMQSLFADPNPNGEKKSESATGGSGNILFAGGTFMALAVMVIMVVVMKRS